MPQYQVHGLHPDVVRRVDADQHQVRTFRCERVHDRAGKVGGPVTAIAASHAGHGGVTATARCYRERTTRPKSCPVLPGRTIPAWSDRRQLHGQEAGGARMSRDAPVPGLTR